MYNVHTCSIQCHNININPSFDLSCVYLLHISLPEPNTSPYVANLKAERNSWFTLITELWAGRVIADAQKDPQVVQQAARNVKLIDSVIRSAENEDATHAKHLDSAVWVGIRRASCI